MLFILALVPLAAVVWIQRIRKPTTREWLLVFAPCVVTLTAIGLTAAWPFLTTNAVGSGEAYNYSLALADAIAQLRAGHLPLAGQTEYAFNGRVHPLRNAPYLFYLGAVFDTLTLRQLTAWQLQNLLVSFSLLFGSFATYVSLRRSTAVSRAGAVLLAAAFLLSPAVLALTHVLNMFMTVHALPFAAIAVGAALRQTRGYRLRNDLWLALSLAGAWNAHPPLALWLTACLVIVRGAIFLRCFNWRSLGGVVWITLVFLALTAFLFAGVRALSEGVDLFFFGPEQRAFFAQSVLHIGREVWPKWWHPISAAHPIDSVSSLQLSYAHWVLLAGGLIATFFGARRFWQRGQRVAAFAILLALAGLFVVTCPIPVVNQWIWLRVPPQVYSLTNVWPMQRTMPLATLFVVFLAALASGFFASRIRRVLLVFGYLILGWTLFQAYPFLKQGAHTGWDEQKTIQSYLNSNIDVTVTSYSYLGTPYGFTYGVVDPELELRLLRDGTTEITTNHAQALAHSREVMRGTFVADPATEPGTHKFLPKLHLEPGKKYLLDFNFRVAPDRAILQFNGPGLSRFYNLPESGSPAAFGMKPENRHTLPLWTSLSTAEDVVLQNDHSKDGPNAGWAQFADFTLREIDRNALPARLLSLYPLRIEVNSPEENAYLETFRQYSPGYIARVNGRETRTEMSQYRGVMLPVPKGRSIVELCFEAPGYVYRAAWISGVAALLAFAWAISRVFRFSWRTTAVRIIRRLPALSPADRQRLRALRRPSFIFGSAAVLAAGIGIWALLAYSSRPHGMPVGPLRLKFVVPNSLVGHREALMSTGTAGQGVIVFYVYPDAAHLQIGIDVWGTLLMGQPTPIRRGQAQELVVDFGALYPPAAPRMKTLPRFAQQQLRRFVRAELNGKSVVFGDLPSYETTPEQIHMGGSAIGGSLADATFHGEFLGSERIPFYTPLALIDASTVNIQLDASGAEFETRLPLFSVGPDGREGVAYVIRKFDDRLVYGFVDARGETIETPPIPATSLTDVRCVLGHAVVDSPLQARFEHKGEHLAGPLGLLPLQKPLVLNRGTNFSNAHDTAARFLGKSLEIEVDPTSSSSTLAATEGAYELYATFANQPTVQPEPLVVTGKTGAGDLVFSQYVDANHIEFGVDHWGLGAPKSPPVEIDYSVPHRVSISLGSLYPPSNDSAWNGVAPDVKERLLGHMIISLDGKVVLDAAVPFHPTTREQVCVGENQIGSSTCGPIFSGQIHAVRRSGLPAATPVEPPVTGEKDK
ncbi:MAG TPA: hypothetical protein VFT72_20110 [Opitutaceae bacterium]|nr:hypothetical protein [Opitutaceae bacterium]